jgi:GDPmannose 4,6-dehydratase
MTEKSPSRKAITGSPGGTARSSASSCATRDTRSNGIVPHSSSCNANRIDHLYQVPHEQDVQILTYYGDLTDSVALTRLVYELQPDEIYHPGAQSRVRVFFDISEYTFT